MAAGTRSLLASVFVPPPSSLLKLRSARNSTRISIIQSLKLHTTAFPTVPTNPSMILGNRFLRERRSLLTNLSSQNSGVEKDELGRQDRSSGGNGGDDGDGWSWTTSFILFGFWAGLMYYVFFVSANQTPSTDLYFLKKLLNLKGDDGFRMNEVLVSLWYLMGLWPIIYSMLLLPTARTQKNKVPLWPFLILSCFGGVYALFPFFILWKPPPPLVEQTELRRWPLNFLESKLTAGIAMVLGLGLIIYAGTCNGDVWKEFYQYFRQSRFIHVMSIDFMLLSAFAPFWVFNDMTTRKWYDKGSWLLPISVIPFLGPAIYIFLRPSMPAELVSSGSCTKTKEAPH
ncbi:unnamed protein product [Cuscuta europaea]|uniref:Cardiolipin synthase N-terminal domain-containing protein n=1 Tax=Cuscuta europaea TaxID=41803 RepID=A0A9P1ELQ2_CUSEU|nr:unnamed protein product [Cuscuta europaea]